MRRSSALLLAAIAGCSDASLSAHDAWIREAPPGAGAMAGYVTLRNGTAAALRCDAAHGPDFGAAELHRTVVEDGVSRMRRDQVVEIPAGGEARLEPGGLHIMLFRPGKPLRAGDRTPLTLDCGGHTITTQFVVRNVE